MTGKALTPDETSAEAAMVGRALKGDRGYVFIQLPPLSDIKHLFGADRPKAGDFTVCGQKILGGFLWAQTATALRGTYCRECERIWNNSDKSNAAEAGT